MASRNATVVYRDQAHDDSRSVTIGELRSEFSTLDRHLTSQFDSQYAFHKDVISDILKRIEKLDAASSLYGTSSTKASRNRAEALMD